MPTAAPPATRRARRWAAAAGAAVALVLAGAGPAAAHATLEHTDPGDGSVLTAAPARVSAQFDEAVASGADSLRVYSPTGVRVDDGTARAGSRPEDVTVTLRPRLGDGTYTVAWHVISADSHPVSGAFTFSIGAPSRTTVNPLTVVTRAGPLEGWLYGVARWTAYLAFALVAGTVVFLAACWPAGAATRGAPRLAAAGWALLAAASAAQSLLQGVYAGALPLSRALDPALLRATAASRFGESAEIRLLILALAAPVLAGRLRRLAGATTQGRLTASRLAYGFTAGLAATWAATGHASTGFQVPLAVLSDIAHLSAMAVWLGGLTALALLVLPGDGNPAQAADAVARFSPVALNCVGVLVLTGAYQAWRDVGSAAALTGSGYGLLVLLKTLGLLVLAALGLLARRRIRAGRPERVGAGPEVVRTLRQLRRAVAAESAVALAVLAVTALLVDSVPGRAAAGLADRPGPTDASVRFDTGTVAGVVLISVSPGAVGPAQAHLTIEDARGEPYDPAQVAVTFSLPGRGIGPMAAPMVRNGPGHYADQAVVLGFPGTWQAAVTIRSDAFDETVLRVPVRVR